MTDRLHQLGAQHTGQGGRRFPDIRIGVFKNMDFNQLPRRKDRSGAVNDGIAEPVLADLND